MRNEKEGKDDQRKCGGKEGRVGRREEKRGTINETERSEGERKREKKTVRKEDK